MNNLVDEKSQKESFLKEMKKFPLPEIKNASLIGKTDRIDFDSIPNSRIVYHEKKTDDPKGYDLYKPSPFVEKWNS